MCNNIKYHSNHHHHHRNNNINHHQSHKQTKWLERTTQSILSAPVGTLLQHNSHTSLRPVLKSWAQTCSCKGATTALSILRRLVAEDEVENGAVLATTAIYCSVIDALAKSGCVVRQLEAEVILREMFRRNNVRPNTVAFNATLDAYAKMTLPMLSENGSIRSNMSHHNNSSSHSQKCQCLSNLTENNRYLDNATQLNLQLLSSYTAVAERAEELLNWMHICRDHSSVNTIAVEESGSCNTNATLDPDTISYNAVLVCYTRAGLASRAEALHNVMEKLYESGEHPNLRPNTHTFTTVCNAWARSGEDGAAQRASAILERMEYEGFIEGKEHMRPNVKTYTCVIDAWAKASISNDEGPLLAESYLNRMEQHGDVGIRPNVQSYAAVLDAWAKSKYPNKAARAHAIVERMKRVYESTGNADVRPNVFCYTAVINAASFTSGTMEEKNAALMIACNTLEDLQQSEYGPPNHVTFTTFLKACANLMITCDRQKFIAEHVFEVARNNGQVSKNLINQYKRIMVDHNVFVDTMNIPQSWGCNVKERQYGYGTPPRSRKSFSRSNSLGSHSSNNGRASPRSSLTTLSSSPTMLKGSLNRTNKDPYRLNA